MGLIFPSSSTAICLYIASHVSCWFQDVLTLKIAVMIVVCRFDEFMLIRQAILLAIDTFGFSHLLPIFGLPLLVSQRHLNEQLKHSKLHIAAQLCQVN